MLELGRVRVRHRLGHLVEVGLGHFLAQALHEVFEVLAGLGRDELVVLQSADLTGEVVGKEIELHPTLGGHLVGDLLAALVLRIACLGLEALDAEPLFAQHVLELFGDLGVRTAQVALFEQLLALHPQLVQQVPKPLHLVTVGGLPPAVEHALKRFVQVPVSQEVVGQLLEDGVGVVGQRLLGAVPLAVVEPPGHPRPL